MKTFAFKFICFLLVQAVLLAWVFRENLPVIRRGYLAAWLDKRERLQTLPPPRLILAGGSGMAFAVDSRALEEALQMPVINMGLHVALGIDFQLNTLKPLLRAGDIVVLSLEYGSLDGFFRTFEVFQIATLEPRVLGLLNGAQQKQAADELHIYIGGLLRNVMPAALERKPPENRVWSRKAFTGRGDVRARLRKVSLVAETADGAASRGEFAQQNRPMAMPSEKVLTRHMEALREFAAVAARQGATVCFTYPAHPAPRLANSARALARFEEAIRSCDGLVVLDRPRDRAYSWNQFFDNFYHLNARGMESHTEDLIPLLEPLRGAR